MTRIVFRMFLVAVFLAGSFGSGQGGELVFGPATFELGKGKPVAETMTFASDVVGAGFALTIRNGDDSGDNRVSSATIMLNGKQIATPSDFNQQVDTLEKDVAIASNNELTVTVNGKPGSFIRIQIGGDAGTAGTKPTATIAADPQSIYSGETATLSWVTNNADVARIEPNLGLVALGGSQAVAPLETTTYVLVAEGQDGTATAQTTVTVNHSEPSASLRAEPTAIVAGESTRLFWICGNAFTCEIDNGIGPVEQSGSLTVMPTEETDYTLTATGLGGVASATATITVNQPNFIGIKVDTPVDGATISVSVVTVYGQVMVPADSEVGVVVNGVPAQFGGGKFIANHIPLVAGWNTLTVIATDADGNKYEAAVQILSEPTIYSVTLTPSQVNGVAPLDVSISVGGELAAPLVYDTLSCGGPATPAPEKIDPSEYRVILTEPGLYDCVIEMRDETGNLYRDRVGISVLGKTAIDTLLQMKWTDMKAAMRQSDVDSAISYFSESTKFAYRKQMTDLANLLPQIANDMGDATLLKIEDDLAVYDFRIIRNGETYMFQLQFVRDTDGLWRIRAY